MVWDKVIPKGAEKVKIKNLYQKSREFEEEEVEPPPGWEKGYLKWPHRGSQQWAIMQKAGIDKIVQELEKINESLLTLNGHMERIKGKGNEK